MGKSNSNHGSTPDKAKGSKAGDDGTSNFHDKNESVSPQPPDLKENKAPLLYSNITLTENPLGESIWDFYEKVRLIEEGGTGELWLVRIKRQQQKQQHHHHHHDDDDDQEATSQQQQLFVVKCIDKNFLFGIFTKELRNEIENLSQIDHPSVVRIYETFETREYLFLVMEYCAGGDLWTRCNCITEQQAARILQQVLSAVAHCHQQKIVHRDLKMENILFETSSKDDDHIKVIDFGYAQHYRRPRGEYTMKMDIGTTYTMSPQVIEGEYTEKCDLWSVGVIAFVLLSGDGTRPFDAEHDKDMRRKILEGKYSMKGAQWDKVSSQAKEFVANLLAYDPDKRWTAEEALQSEWLQTQTSSSSSSLINHDTDDPNTNSKTIQEALVHSAKKEPKLKRLVMMIIAHNTPARKLQDLHQAFDAIDRSHDGTITFDEFRHALRAWEGGDSLSQDDELRDIFDELDQSGTGVISYSEFLAATLETTGKIEPSQVEEAFEKLDMDNSGAITKETLDSVLETSGAPSESNILEGSELMEELGTNANDAIDYETFSSMFEK